MSIATTTTAAAATTTTATALESLSVTRITKAGKEVKRTSLGIALTGNKEEKAQLAFTLAEEFWFEKANLRPFLDELHRVFPSMAKSIEGRNESVNALLAEDPNSKLELINSKAPTKRDVLAMFQLARRMTGADKGAKAQLLSVGAHLASLEATYAARKAERAAQFDRT